MSEKTLGEKFRDFVSFTGPAIPEEIAPGQVEGRELPRYRSHKVVAALKLKEVLRRAEEHTSELPSRIITW